MTSESRPSAKIYRFPRRLPPAYGSARSAAPMDRRLETLPVVEAGSGWYHEAAIEADRVRRT